MGSDKLAGSPARRAAFLDGHCLWDSNCDFPREQFPLLLFLLLSPSFIPQTKSKMDEMWEKRFGKNGKKAERRMERQTEATEPLSERFGNRKGASRYDVHKIFGFFDPLSPLARIWI